MPAADFRRVLRDNTGLRLMVLFGSFCIGLMVASVIPALFTSEDGAITPSGLRWSALAQCFFAFCMPAWLTSRFASDCPWKWLGVDSSPGVKGYGGVVILYVIALPFMNQLIEWNASMHFPQWASGLEETLRGWEDSNQNIASRILDFNNAGGMIATVAVVGVATGFSEELFFRGGLQGVFMRGGIAKGTAIWMAALIFSAIHFQFFGFVPRLLMGAMFGYLLCWSGSIWLPAFAHALNNSVVVIFSGTGAFSTGIDSLGVAGGEEFPWAAIASAAATFLFLLRFRKYFFFKS